MQKQIILDQEDIRGHLADAFSVDTKDVYIELIDVTEGYGLAEHTVKKIRATIELPANDKR